MSAGMRSGVNWIRENAKVSARPNVRTSNVLPRPGTPSNSTCPLAKSAIIVCSTMRSWPTIALAIWTRKRSKTSRKAAHACWTDSTSSKARSNSDSAASSAIRPIPALLFGFAASTTLGREQARGVLALIRLGFGVCGRWGRLGLADLGPRLADGFRSDVDGG